MRGLFFIVVVSLFCNAKGNQTPYNLKYIEGFEKVSTNKLLQSMNIGLENLYEFRCENPERFELFGQDQSFAGHDSLRIMGVNKVKYIYKDRKLYLEKNGRRIRFVNDTYTNKVLDSLKKLEKTETGSELILKMQSSPHIYYILAGSVIEEEKDGVITRSLNASNHVDGRDLTYSLEERADQNMKMENQFSNFQTISFLDSNRDKSGGIKASHIGGKGSIVFNPLVEYKYIDTDYQIRTDQIALTLAHEMYHAYDAARGMLDLRYVIHQEAELDQHNDHVSEHRAVRLANTIRKEMKLPYRRFYSNVSKHSIPKLKKFKSMLDENNEPVIIPTPCINWL